MGNNLMFELKPHLGIETDCESVTLEIINPENEIDAKLDEINNKISGIDISVDKYTNHADNIDYAIAVASGILTGLIDSLFVGKWNFKEAETKSNKIIEDFIMDYAKRKGYNGNHLNGAISFLEDKYPVLQDNSWSGKGIGVSAKSHHLDDLAHHPTLLGLVSSVIVEFFRVGFFVNKDGEYHFTLVDTEPKDVIKAWFPVIISGLLLWTAQIAENHYEDKMDEEIPKPIKNLITALATAPLAIKLLKVSANWAGHLVSDMGGSKKTAGGGMGIPGLFLSLMKKISSIPGVNLTPLPKLVNDWYTKDKADMRTELAVGLELGRQAIPVIINEVLVRSFYFIKYLVVELKNKQDFKQVEWSKITPFGNRTVERMMTIASGTFSAFDFADATIRSGGLNSSLLLRLNFVGIGRFTVALGTDVYMGWRKGKLSKERMLLKADSLYLLEAKIYHGEALMWSALKDANESIDSLLETIQLLTSQTSADIKAVQNSITEIEQIDISLIEEKNQDLIEDLLNTL